MPMTIELTVLISICCTMLGAAIGLLGHRRNKNKDLEADAMTDAIMATDIGYIKSGIDDIKRKQAEQDRNHLEVVTRLAAVESSTKQAHKRLDRVEGKEY